MPEKGYFGAGKGSQGSGRIKLRKDVKAVYQDRTTGEVILVTDNPVDDEDDEVEEDDSDVFETDDDTASRGGKTGKGGRKTPPERIRSNNAPVLNPKGTGDEEDELPAPTLSELLQMQSSRRSAGQRVLQRPAMNFDPLPTKQRMKLPRSKAAARDENGLPVLGVPGRS